MGKVQKVALRKNTKNCLLNKQVHNTDILFCGGNGENIMLNTPHHFGPVIEAYWITAGIDNTAYIASTAAITGRRIGAG